MLKALLINLTGEIIEEIVELILNFIYFHALKEAIIFVLLFLIFRYAKQGCGCLLFIIAVILFFI